MTTTILDIRPGLAGLIGRVRERLPSAARDTLDEHVTAAERLVSDVFGDLPLWRLRGSDALWVRSADLAEVMEVTQSTISEQVSGAEGRGELSSADVRRGVRPEDVDPSSNYRDSRWLTSSPHGVLMVTLRAARLLVMSCRGDRGVSFRHGLDRLLDTASATERLLVALLLDRAGSADPRALRTVNATARLLLQAGDKVAARTLLRSAHGLPEIEAPAPVPTPDDPLLQWLAGRRETSAGEVAAAFGIGRERAGHALKRVGWLRTRRTGGRGERAWLYLPPAA